MSTPGPAARPHADSLPGALYRAYWRTMGIPDADIDRDLRLFGDTEGHWGAVADAAVAWLAVRGGELRDRHAVLEAESRTLRLRAERAASAALEGQR